MINLHIYYVHIIYIHEILYDVRLILNIRVLNKSVDQLCSQSIADYEIRNRQRIVKFYLLTLTRCGAVPQY